MISETDTGTSSDARPDAQAVRDVYIANAGDLMRFATGLVGRDEAADLLSSAVVKSLAARHWTTLDDPRAYLYRAVYREALSFRRRAARSARASWRSMIARDTVVDEIRDPDVARAILALPARQRAAVVLTYWQDLSAEQVAERLGVSVGAVKQHLARGRQALRKALS